MASRLIIAVAALALPFNGTGNAQQQPRDSRQNLSAPTTVTLHWGARPGVFRYRLQLASDAGFTDIVLDRVVAGREYKITDLAPGKYFWRVAPLGATFNDSSTAGVVEIRPPSIDNAVASPTPAAQKPGTGQSTLNAAARGGWYAAIGTVSTPLLAHVRSSQRQDVIALSSDGRLVALDAASGVELWAVRTNSQTSASPIALRSPAGLDNVLVLAGNSAKLFEGKTGRALWQSTLPAAAASALVVNGRIFVLDNSLQKLFVINGAGGQMLAQTQLARRAVGAPAAFELEPRGVMVALEDGRIQVIDETGKVLRAGSAESAATTAPIFVRGARGTFVLVGTKDGLTALSAADLRPLGRITLKNDTPRGALTAVDVDGDHNPEVVMLTEHGRIFVIKSDEGRILWESDARHAEAVTFADVNADGALDLLLMSKEGFAFALSGRDGSPLWNEEAAAAANHAPSLRPRSAVIARTSSGTLLITNDAGRGGLRAIQFPLVVPRNDLHCAMKTLLIYKPCSGT